MKKLLIIISKHLSHQFVPFTKVKNLETKKEEKKKVD